MQTHSLKRGDTLAMAVLRLTPDGMASVLNTTLTAQMRRYIDDPDPITLTVTKETAASLGITETVPDNLVPVVRATASQTSAWALGDYVADVQFDDNGTITSTDTFRIRINGDLTNG